MTLSDQVMDLASQVLAGAADAESLRGPLEQLAVETAQAQESFEEHPEVTPEAAKLMLKALGRLEGALEQSQQAVAEGDLAELAQAVELAGDCLGTIRGLQAGYTQALDRGPTFHPFLNRVLLHLGYFERGGRETAATRDLLRELPRFIQEMKTLVGAVPEAQEALEELEDACVTLLDSLSQPSPQVLGQIQTRLLAANQSLALILGGQLEAELSFGPTAWAPANLVVLAAERLQAGHATPELFRESLESCQKLLANRLPPDGDPALQAAAEHVMASLNKLAESVLPEDLQRFVEATQAMLALASMETEDPLVNVVHGDGLIKEAPLPPLLAGLTQLAEDFQAGKTGPAQLEQGVEALNGLLQRTEAGTLPDPDKKRQLDECRELLRATISALHGLLDGQSDNLEKARQSMKKAAQILVTL